MIYVYQIVMYMYINMGAETMKLDTLWARFGAVEALISEFQDYTKFDEKEIKLIFNIIKALKKYSNYLLDELTNND